MIENKENLFYQGLGEFIVNYENVIQNIKRGIIFLMHNFNNGGNNNYQECLHILISEMESGKLIHKYGALLFLFIKKENEYYNKIDELLKTTETLNELRNNLIHRYYMIGSNLETGELGIASMNQKTKKSGLNHNFKNITDIDLKEININIKKLNTLFNGLDNIVSGEIMLHFKNIEISEIKEIRKMFEKYLKE